MRCPFLRPAWVIRYRQFYSGLCTMVWKTMLASNGTQTGNLWTRSFFSSMDKTDDLRLRFTDKKRKDLRRIMSLKWNTERSKASLFTKSSGHKTVLRYLVPNGETWELEGNHRQPIQTIVSLLLYQMCLLLYTNRLTLSHVHLICILMCTNYPIQCTKETNPNL